MGDDDLEPELAGYEPHDGRRGQRRLAVIRVMVALGLVALVVPGILVAIGTAQRTAEHACGVYVATYAAESVAAVARFELIGRAGPGWQCYAVNFDGSELLLRSLGIIPGPPRLPAVPAQES